MSDDITMVGNNCGNCERGDKPMSTPECKKCGDVEAETGKKFTQHTPKKR